MTNKAIAGEKEHQWFKPDFMKHECCKNCGYVRNETSDQRPCHGLVKINFREVAEKAKRSAELVVLDAKVTDEQMRQRMTI